MNECQCCGATKELIYDNTANCYYCADCMNAQFQEGLYCKRNPINIIRG